MQLEDGNWTYFEWKMDAHSASWVRNEHEMSAEKAPQKMHGWLLNRQQWKACATRRAFRQMKACAMELTAYENNTFIYNLGFGIRREN